MGSVLVVNTARRYTAVFNKSIQSHLIPRYFSDTGILRITNVDTRRMTNVKSVVLIYCIPPVVQLETRTENSSVPR